MAPWARRLGCVLCPDVMAPPIGRCGGQEVKRDFGDLPIRRSEGRVVNTPLVFKRVLFEEKRERGKEKEQKKRTRESGRENGRKEEERRKERERDGKRRKESRGERE
ncbi:hypothetical protein TNCV_945001 [Trichonephila clavipes]|nr:hypothetical protein TNCV_945001 [Trichonephila clavipes]